MPPLTVCPKTSEFQSMLLEQLPQEDLCEIEEHLEVCSICQHRLERLSVNPILTDVLQSNQSNLPPHGRLELDSLATRLDLLVNPSSSAQSKPDSQTKSSESLEILGNLERVGVYRIIHLLGAGGMGLIFLAEDEVLFRRVAVKILRPGFARKPEAKESFLREARAMASLKHDNVATVFHVGEVTLPNTEPLPYLAMELLVGETLADWLRREGCIPPAWAIRIGIQTANGLAAAHACGVVHRDIKPGNLWLESPSWWSDLQSDHRQPLPSVARVKVLDFGLAQLAGHSESDGGLVGYGTPEYMSPEQAIGDDVDHRSDLFSLGVVLYELVTGTRPFPGRSKCGSNPYSPPQPIDTLAPATPPGLIDLIHRLLSRNPVLRPNSAKEVIAELAALAEATGADTVPVAKDTTRPVPVRKKGKPWRFVTALPALVVVSTIGVYTTYQTPDREREQKIIPSLSFQRDDAINEQWLQVVSNFSAPHQLDCVIAKMRELNPGYDGSIQEVYIDRDLIVALSIQTDTVTDIRPIQALRGLKNLTVVGSVPGSGKLQDLTPIQSLPIGVLNIWNNPELTDLSVLSGMKLNLLQAGDTAISDLTPLSGMPLEVIAINNCHVQNLSPISTMPRIRYLRCDGCPIESLDSLVDSALKELQYNFKKIAKDEAFLQRRLKLQRINGQTLSEFEKKHLPK